MKRFLLVPYGVVIQNAIFDDLIFPVIFIELNNSEKNPEGERHPTRNYQKCDFWQLGSPCDFR